MELEHREKAVSYQKHEEPVGGSNFVRGVLWLLTGATWWLCAHSMTLILPFPGPWLPAGSAVPAGLLMGLLGFILFEQKRVSIDRTSRRLLRIVGTVAGVVLGWIYARGPLAEGNVFLPATREDLELSILVCAILGLSANTGLIWLMENTADRPLRLLACLLLLLSILFGAVVLLVVTYES